MSNLPVFLPANPPVTRRPAGGYPRVSIRDVFYFNSVTHLFIPDKRKCRFHIFFQNYLIVVHTVQTGQKMSLALV